jgi:molybdate transport system substrate-binding protein
MLEANGSATERFTYAIGRLVLWTGEPGQPVDEQRLIDGDFKKLAIANPKTAPYGAAAVEVMRHLGLYEQLRPKLVLGDSIAQTYQFAATGNAELGFVALSQTTLDQRGGSWLVPRSGYTEIRQDAVLLEKGRSNPAARALLAYLKGEAGRTVIQKYGYGTN